jgi:hypothetical protein
MIVIWYWFGQHYSCNVYSHVTFTSDVCTCLCICKQRLKRPQPPDNKFNNFHHHDAWCLITWRLGNLHQSKGNVASSQAIVANAWNRMSDSQKPNALWWGHPKTSWASSFSYDWNMILSLRHTGRTCRDADCWLTTRTRQIIRLLHESRRDRPAEHSHLSQTQLR